jgi:hypothetical protein
MQREFLLCPSILIQSPPPCANSPDDSSVIRVVISWPPEPHVPKPPDVPFACKDIICLRIIHPPFPLVMPGPPCLGQLFAGSTGHELSRCVNKVDIVKEIVNYLLPLVPGFTEKNIQVSQDKGDAALWAGFPCSPKILHPHRVCGGDVYAHAVESLVASTELEREEVQRSNSC